MESIGPTYHISISKEALSKLPVAEYNGKIHLIDSTEQTGAAIEVLQRETILGFDTETKPTFKKGKSNNVALIQLATRTDCFLFRINRTGITSELCGLLENSRITKIGLSVHDDFHNLAKITDIKPAGFIELQQYVKQFGIMDNSLARIYAILFGRRISKGQRLSNWEAPVLTASQQSYASLDARACIDIYDYISANRFDPSKSEYIVTDTVGETLADNNL